MSAHKPTGAKAYGSIPHLPGSRLGPGDHRVSPGQARIACEQTRDRHDEVIVEEKLDGSCVAVARVRGELVALQRRGYPARTSPYEQHHLFADWVDEQQNRFDFLEEGERLVGEWLAQAHGTLYDLTDTDPFVAFDLFAASNVRLPIDAFMERVRDRFVTPPLLSRGRPVSIEEALRLLGPHGRWRATTPVEGVVWRIERKGKVDFLAKYVRPDKVDGCYLPEISGRPPVWNWRPGSTTGSF